MVIDTAWRKTLNIRSDQRQTIGQRLARLRSEHGWTQQALADRLAISRVAISQIEMDLTLPSERTITLLAGIFKLSPPELVEGTFYPPAKAERLPEITCWYTRLELELELMENDLEWLKRLAGSPKYSALANETWQKWGKHLEERQRDSVDEKERALIKSARSKLAANNSATAPE